MSSEKNTAPAPAPEPTKVEYIKTKTRFKDMVNRADGIRISEAVKRAEAKIEEYKETGLAAVDDSIAQMHGITLRLRTEANETDERKLYLLSNDVFAAAGMYGQPELSEAAYSLCDLLGNRPENAPLIWESINVHVATMRILRQKNADTDAEVRQQVLAGLKQVTARITTDAAAT